MFCVSALARLVTSCLGYPFSLRNASSEGVLDQDAQKLTHADRELSEGNLLLAPRLAAKNQVPLHHLIDGENGKNLLPSLQIKNYFLREVWKIIAQFSDLKDIKNLRLVNREMNVIASPHIKFIEIVNAKELLGALNFLMQTGLHTTTLRLAKGGWNRSTSRFNSYPNINDKNLKIELAKFKNEKSISNVQQNSPLPVENLQFYGMDLNQAEFILGNEKSASFSKWKKVESLVIKECQLSMKSFVKILQAMPNLRKLKLFDCKGLNDLNPSVLGFYSLNMAALTINNLGLNSLSLKNFSLLEKLESLCLSGVEISDSFFRAILKNKPHLKKLEIDLCTGLTRSAFSVIKDLRLESLKLIKCNISDEIFNHALKYQYNLKKLEVNSCLLLTASAFNVIEKLQLSSLKIIACKISNSVLNSALKYQSELRELELDFSAKLIDSEVLFLERLKLKSLNLSNGNFSNSTANSIGKVIKNLEVLKLSKCHGIYTSLFNDVFLLSNMKNFYLDGYRLPDISFEATMRTMPNLEILSLSKVKFLEESIFLNLTILKKINTLILEKTNIPNNLFQAIISSMPNLKNIYLKGSFGFTDIALLSVINLKKLDFLDITDCQFSKKILKTIKNHVRNVIS